MCLAAKTIEIFYFDAGGGHRNAMHALCWLIAARHPDRRVVPVDLQRLLEPIDPVNRLTRRLNGSLQRLLVPVAPNFQIATWQAQDIYNTALKRGTTRGLGAILPILQGFVRRYAQEIEQILVDRWRNPETPRPDLVLSVIPNFNRVMFCALRAFAADIPYATVITDMVDYPPHFWMEDQDQFVICGTPKAAKQARATGFYAEDRIFEVSGMILKESFYQFSGPESPTLAGLGIGKRAVSALTLSRTAASTTALPSSELASRRPSSTSTISLPISRNSASPKPRVVPAGRAEADTRGDERLFRVERNAVLVAGDEARPSACSARLPVAFFLRRSTSIRWLSVPPETTSSPCSISVAASALALATTWRGIGLELGLQRFLEGHGLGGDDMHQRPALQAGEDAELIFLAMSSSLVRIMPPRGPRSDLCVVVVVTWACGTGEGCTPPATRPAMWAMSTIR
jgi:hypothetical protein